jgi:hypothetical protein
MSEYFDANLQQLFIIRHVFAMVRSRMNEVLYLLELSFFTTSHLVFYLGLLCRSTELRKSQNRLTTKKIIFSAFASATFLIMTFGI